MNKNMNYYNKKCIGCGNYFSNDINSCSYVSNVNKDTKYCQRCFKLINYNHLDNSNVNEEQIIDTLNQIDYKNNLIVMVLDLFDIKNSIVEKLATHDNILVVVNKLNCLPTSFNKTTTLNKIKNILIEANVRFLNLILYDSINNINIKTINDFLYKHFKNKKSIYIVGKTNVGKSSLINALLKYNKINNKLSTSSFPNTTINLLKIDLGRYFVIDTPGYINKNSIINLLSHKDIKKICDFKKTVNKIFSVKDNNQTFFVEKLFYISIINQNEGSISFYGSSNLKIHRTKTEKISQILNSNEIDLVSYCEVEWIKKEFCLDENKKYNIFVNGICLISLKKISKIIIGVNSKISIYVSENALI